MKRYAVLAGILLFLCMPAFGDQVVLKNGDRFSGTIVKSDGKVLVIKTEFAGEVTVQYDAIDQITSGETLHVSVKDGKTVAGPVTTSDGNVVVATASNGSLSLPKAEVVSIRDDAEEAAYEKSLHPSLTFGWAGGINLGFALTRGNSATKNLNLAFNSIRKTTTDQITLYANSVYATNDASGAVPGTIANSIQGGARYDRNLTSRLFFYGNGDFQTDDLQNLNLRSVLGGGFGYHAIKQAATTIDLLGGLNYTHESYTTFSRSFPAATLGEELRHKWRTNTLLTQSVYFYPDLSDIGEYRATFNAGAVTKINKWLGWQVAFGDIYVTNPPAGKKKNDILFTTGLNIAFVH